MNNVCAVILAGGKGKRMGSAVPKMLFEVLYQPMIEWVILACNEADIKEKCVVLGHKAEQIKSFLGDNLSLAFQEKQIGTADALKCANSFLLKNINSDVFVCCGDSPLLSGEIIKNSYDLHKKTKACATIITAKVQNPTGFGRIIRGDNGLILKVVEEKDASLEQKNINEINSGAYWFCVKDILNILKDVNSQNSQKEYYLTDVIYLFIKQKKLVSGFISEDEKIALGVNNKLDLLRVSEIARKGVIESLAKIGVEFINTDGIIISPKAKIGKNTLILPGSIIKGNTIIGEDCKIGPNTLIDSSNIKDGCVINSSQIYNSEIGKHTTIGPFCHIRPNSHISHHVKIGDFVEVKNSNIGRGTSISHLTYVGDSDVGDNVNFGCGVVTINFDGVKKHRCTIKDGAFIGCNTNLVAPVTLGKNSYTGAGSTITKDIPDEALGIQRTNQVNVKDFSKIKLANRKLKFEG